MSSMGICAVNDTISVLKAIKRQHGAIDHLLVIRKQHGARLIILTKWCTFSKVVLKAVTQ